MEMKIMKITSGSENDKAMKYAKDYWRLGPEVASVQPKDNKPYWEMMGLAWNISPEEARRRLCANCEYYNNTPEAQEEMESIPFNKYDLDGGGRGYCVEFDFICHNLRTCQGWEKKDFENEHTEEESSEPEDEMPISNGLGKMKPKTMKEMLNEK